MNIQDKENSKFNENLNILKSIELIDTRPNPINGEEDDNKKVFDLYNRAQIGQHIANFVQHSAARGIEPTLDVILDFLYSKKTYSEKDNFVRIERLIEMVSNGQVYPNLIVEVLNYALAVEKAAINVLNDNIKNNELKENEHMKELQKALALRLEVENNK